MLYRLDRQVRLLDLTETSEAVFIANFWLDLNLIKFVHLVNC